MDFATPQSWAPDLESAIDRHPVADVMINPVVTLPAQSVSDIFAAIFLFRRYRIRHLPIVSEIPRLLKHH